MVDFTLSESYGLSDGQMYMLNWNVKDVVLGPIIGFFNGVWRGRFAWKDQSPDFDTQEEIAHWMLAQYQNSLQPMS